MSSSYLNFDGQLMTLSAGPTVWKNTTAKGQTLTGTAGANNQLSDQFGGATLNGGSGDDTFCIMDSATKIVGGGGTDTVNAWCGYTMAAGLKNLNLYSDSVTGAANTAGDLIIALGKNDTLVSGTGKDVLVDGGAGGTTFTFAAGGNHDVIIGFQASGASHDVINVTNLGYFTLAQVQSHLTQVGADTLLTFNSSDAVLIRNTTASSLTASDFVLAAATTAATTASTTTTTAATTPAPVTTTTAAATTTTTTTTVAASPVAPYSNYAGQAMHLSNAPLAWLSTSAAGQTLTATAVATQLSDQKGGAPTLIGGVGDNTYCILDANTKIVEAANGGTDTVLAWCNYTMAANLEDLTLENPGLTGTANNSGDLIIALGKGDTLVGGTGLDVLVDGGAGGDTFSFNTAGNHDVVVGFQAAGANHDILNVANFGYSTFAQVQSHLTQVGADTLLTLSGSDAVLIRNTTVSALTAADFALAPVPVAAAAASTTAAVAAVTTAISASPYANFFGAAPHLSASPVAWLSTSVAGQTLTATSAATQLSDALGGAPTLVGGSGDNTYCILDANTKIVEAANGGTDTVLAWSNYTLPANVENLTIETGHSTGVGNTLGNILIAQGVNDTLVGGTGSDVFVDGGAGSDVFSLSQGGGHDTIVGFKTTGISHDFIQLTNYGFTSFAQVQSHLTQVGADTLLTLSANDAVLIRNTTVAALNANDFLLQLDTSQMKLTFDGEFNSLSLYNPATGQGVWKTNYISGVQSSSDSQAFSSRTLTGNGEQEIYVDPTYAGTGKTALGLNPFSINNGVLTITASKAPTADVSALSGYQYTSGLLTTEKSFSQLYGYFEIKAELPTGQGVWPAFWLLPADGGWPPELDVMEAIGGNKIYQTVHTDVTGTATQTAFTTDLSNVSSGFHTYGVLWNAQNIDYYIDGVEVASTATPADMNKPMYLLVDLALGGTFPGNVASSFTSAQMQVDYVKAYSLTSSQAAAAGSTNVAVLQSATDKVAASIDTVESAFTYSLAATTAHNLVLTGTANINATANNLGDHLTGNAGTNILTGGTGADTLTAGTGNDTLTGGGGLDTFVFNQGSAHDVITDFSGHDVLDISSYLKAGLTPTLTDAGNNVTLSFATGTTIQLLGVHAHDLIQTSIGFTH